MKKIKYNNVLTLASGAMLLSLAGSLSSCRDQNFDFDEHRFGTTVEQVYNKTFTDTFGEVDPNHTWIPFTETSVTVSVSQHSDIKIFDHSGKIVAQFAEVLGTQTLNFDVPFGENDIIVVQNDALAKDAKVGGTITFGGTRTSYTGNDIVSISYTEEYKTLKIDSIKEITKKPGGILPENEDNIGKNGVKQNFEFTSNGGTFTIYPIYWYTGAELTFGIYYKDASGDIVCLPIYHKYGKDAQANQRDNDLLQGKVPNTDTWQDIPDNNKESIKYSSSPDTDYSELQSRGIEITIPSGVVFGLYCEQSEKKFYSKKEDNSDCVDTPDNKAPHTHGAQYTDANGVDYFSFEDWDNNTFDYNDMIFIIENKPRVLDFSAQGFMMAFEDMGSIGDFDFNDVVLQVEPNTDGTTGTVSLLAAGATYEIDVLYDRDGTCATEDDFASLDPIVWKDDKTEVHDVFGVDKSTMVNTGYYGASPISISNFNFGTGINGVTDIAKRFCLRVKTKNAVEGQKAEYNYIQIPNKTEGMAPQGFVVRGVLWEWPNERQSILERYPKFKDWVQSQQNVHWYEPDSPEGTFN